MGALLSMLKLDGWVNAVTGLGSALYDKTKAALFRRRAQLPDPYLEALYEDDPLARRICELRPDEMMRPGFTLSLGDLENAIDVQAEVLAQLADLQAVPILKSAMVWESVFGGSAVLISVDDGASEPSEPLVPETVRAVTGLTLLDKPRMFARQWYLETSLKAGQVELWEVTPLGGGMPIVIHESRLLLFPGGRVTAQRRLELQGWGQSLLQGVHDVLSEANMSWNALSYMLQSANQDVWYMQGVMNALQSNDDTANEYFNARFLLAQRKMGVNRAITLDSEGEKFERHPSTFTGVPESMELICLRLAAVTGYPMTKLFGMSPAGMNATGESDMRNWYDSVAAKRAESPQPQLEKLIGLILASSEGPTKGAEIDSWDIKWNPFERMTEIETATLRKTVAETDQIYIDKQVLLPEEIAVNRFRPEGWSGETDIDQEAHEAMLKAELDRAKDEAKNPPEPPPVDPNAIPPDPNDPNAPKPPAPKPGDDGNQ